MHTHGIRKRLLACLAASLLVLLSGCGGGGGGGGGNPSPATVVISGIVSDDPIAGAGVTLFTLSGQALGTATTNVQGAYSLTVTESAVAGGYELRATGGTLNGVAFSETLTAVYAPSENKSAANLTLVTSLVSALAQGQTGATLLDKRNAAISLLIDIDALGSTAQWSALSPDSVDLAVLRNVARSRSIATWVSDLRADLADGVLSPDNMGGFPNAHGSITDINFGDAVMFSVFQGEAINWQLEVAALQSGISWQYGILPPTPAWISVDLDGLVTATVPAQGVTGDVPLLLEVTNPGTGSGRILSSNLFVMPTEVVSQGTIDDQGGQVVDAVSGVALVIPQGTLSVPTTFNIVRGLGADGQYAYQARSDPRTEKPFALYVPDPYLRATELEGGSGQPVASQSGSVPAKSATIGQPTARSLERDPAGTDWVQYGADFVSDVLVS